MLPRTEARRVYLVAPLRLGQEIVHVLLSLRHPLHLAALNVHTLTQLGRQTVLAWTLKTVKMDIC